MSIDRLVYGYLAKEENYPDGANIIKEGGTGNWVYIILKGQAEVKKNTSRGVVTIETLKQGEIFGEMLFLQAAKRTRSASIIANGPVQLGVLDSQQLLDDYASVSPQLKSLINSLITKLEEATNKAVTMISESKK